MAINYTYFFLTLFSRHDDARERENIHVTEKSDKNISPTPKTPSTNTVGEACVAPRP